MSASNSIAWFEDEVDDFLEMKAAERDAKAAERAAKARALATDTEAVAKSLVKSKARLRSQGRTGCEIQEPAAAAPRLKMRLDRSSRGRRPSPLSIA